MLLRGSLSRPAVVACSLLFFCLLVRAFPQDASPADLRPDPGRLHGWLPDGDPQAYEGDDLFLYMDGGAEIYREYGFDRVLVQDYRKAGLSLTLEIFRMTSADGAFGIFTFKRSGAGRVLGIGSADSLEEGYLNFWKGRFLVTVTGTASDPATIEGIGLIARGVADRIGESADPPRLCSVFAGGGFVVSGLKYLKGHLGLFNIHPFFEDDVFRAKEAAKADAADGGGAFVFAYDSPSEASARGAAVEKAFRESPRYRNLRRAGDGFRVEDRDGRACRLGVSGRFILMIGGAPTPESEARAFERLAASLARSGP